MLNLEQFFWKIMLMRFYQSNHERSWTLISYRGAPGEKGSPGPKGDQGTKGDPGEQVSDFKGPVSKYNYIPLTSIG